MITAETHVRTFFFSFLYDLKRTTLKKYSREGECERNVPECIAAVAYVIVAEAKEARGGNEEKPRKKHNV